MRFTTLGISLIGLFLSCSAQSNDISTTQLINYHVAHLKSSPQDSPSLSATEINQLDNLGTYKLPDEMMKYRIALQKIIASHDDASSGVENIFNTTKNPHRNSLYDKKIGRIEVIPGKSPHFVMMAPCQSKLGNGDQYIEQDLLDPKHPHLIAIDNIHISYWIHVLKAYIPSQNPARIYEQSIAWLERINQARTLMGKPLDDEAILTFTSLDNTAMVDHSVRLVDDFHICPKHNNYNVHFVDTSSDTNTLTASPEGEIAYVPLPEMYNLANNDDAIKLFMLLEQLRSTSGKKGMILDLRDNNHGDLTALVALYPFLSYHNDSPKIANLMVYRRLPDASAPWENPSNDKLNSQFSFLADNAIWSHQERLAINAFEVTNTLSGTNHSPTADSPPQYGDKNFSHWHFLVMSPHQQFFRNIAHEYAHDTEKDALIADNMSNLITRWDNLLPQYHRPGHIVVLANQGTYGAAEVFLSAVKGMEGVTIMGSPSSGGSSIVQSHTLPCGTIINLSSTLSVTAEGKSYGHIGIEPDYTVLPQTEDFRFRQYLNTNQPQAVHPEDHILKQAIHFIKTTQTATHREVDLASNSDQ